MKKPGTWPGTQSESNGISRFMTKRKEPRLESAALSHPSIFQHRRSDPVLSWDREHIRQASSRDLRFDFDVGEHFDVTAPHEEVWLIRAIVGVAIFATKQPVLHQLPLQTAAD